MTDAPNPMPDEIEWPREIWMAERDEHDQGVVSAVLSEHATVARFEGDVERDREFHRYIDADIYDSAERYWKARTDHHLALVAAAYLDAANLHQSLWRETSAYKTDQILKRAPDDAQAALERMKRKARIEGMRKAADVAEDWFHRIGHGNPQDEIRALIEEEQTNE
jgi:hypothetical protein